MLTRGMMASQSISQPDKLVSSLFDECSLSNLCRLFYQTLKFQSEIIMRRITWIIIIIMSPAD